MALVECNSQVPAQAEHTQTSSTTLDLVEEMETTLLEMQEIVDDTMEKTRLLSVATHTNTCMLKDIKEVVRQALVVCQMFKDLGFFTESVQHTMEFLTRVQSKYKTMGVPSQCVRTYNNIESFSCAQQDSRLCAERNGVVWEKKSLE